MTSVTFSLLPDDVDHALLIGRIWDPQINGPRVIAVRGDAVYAMPPTAATVSGLLELPDYLQVVQTAAAGEPTWRTADVLDASLKQDKTRPHLLAPIDLQVVKACGSPCRCSR